MPANCANCGAEIERRNSATRLVACPYCDTTQMFVDDAFQLAGQQGVMQDVPTLFHLGQPVVVDGITLTPIGHARFSYGRGWWDEFWCDAGHRTLWVSVDEGDVAIESPVPEDERPSGFVAQRGAEATLGDVRYRVTETETAECIAVRGEFPEMLSVGEKHAYFDLSGPGGEIVTLEQWEGNSDWYRGRWVDPWDVKAAG